MSDQILVTGAAGYLGGHLVRELRDAGHNVTPVVRPGRERDSQSAACDLTDMASVTALISTSRPSAIVHAAAWIGSGPVTNESVAAAIAGNVTTTANLVSACAGLGLRRFILCSSVEVYAAAPTDGVAHKEGDSLVPQGLYGCTKAASELIVQSLCGTGTEVRIFRMPGLHGPPRTTGVVHRMAEAAHRGNLIEVDEPGTRLSMLWCSDAARCIAAGATGMLKGTDTKLNLANGEVTLIALAESIGRAAGKSFNIRSGTKNSRNRVLDLTRLRAALPFEMPSFEEQLPSITNRQAVA